MYSLNSLWDIFNFEFFLFGGVPETAVQMYEREFHSYAEVRHTRERLRRDTDQGPDHESTVFRTIEYDTETGEFSVLEPTCEK